MHLILATTFEYNEKIIVLVLVLVFVQVLVILELFFVLIVDVNKLAPISPCRFKFVTITKIQELEREELKRCEILPLFEKIVLISFQKRPTQRVFNQSE